MNNIVNLTHENFLLFAAHNYNNVSCTTVQEFEDDLKRIQYIKKLFSKYKTNKDLKVRLVLNHLIILSNIFGSYNTVCMLFLKIPEYACYFIPFLKRLHILPDSIKYVNGCVINIDNYTVDINIDWLIDESFAENSERSN